MQRCELLKMVGRRCHDRQCPARTQNARELRGVARREDVQAEIDARVAERHGVPDIAGHRRDPRMRANRVSKRCSGCVERDAPRGRQRVQDRREVVAGACTDVENQRRIVRGRIGGGTDECRGQRREVARLEDRGAGGDHRGVIAGHGTPTRGAERHVSVAGDVEGMPARAAQGSAPDCEPA